MSRVVHRQATQGPQAQSQGPRLRALVRRSLWPLTHRHAWLLLSVCAALLCVWAAPAKHVAPAAPITTPANAPTVAPANTPTATPAGAAATAADPGAADLDANLQRAATAALGARAGTVVVLDPQTGRVRAIVNPRAASEAAFPPGSTVKPFTLLTALRSGVIDADTRLLCRKHYARTDAEFTCSHPASLPPFSPVQALAYSCNYFFARLAERLRPADFNQLLAAYGFGARTGWAAEFEQAGRLPRAHWRLRAALGEDEDLLVTPLQLLTAYAALGNGGQLYTPQLAAPDHCTPQVRTAPALTSAERTLLLAGLRGAIRYGTAEKARLEDLPVTVFGKTGTATEAGGLHTHGWFVGLAAESARTDSPAQTATPAPAAFKLAVLVFLNRATGAQSAAVARPIFVEFARARSDPNQNTGTPARATAAATWPSAGAAAATSQPDAAAWPDGTGAPGVRVHLVRTDVTHNLALEDYVFGVLAAEASTESEYEAIKTLAVVSRTFALHNLRRHARAGYDFCNLTHCQRYLAVTTATVRPEFHALLRRAVRETAGEVLRADGGQLANAYFSASCGGMTANLATLWGVPARAPYERGVRDPFCAGLPNSTWTDVLPAAALARALHEDERSDVGPRLDAILVTRRDATGRAELVTLAGEQRRTLRGWEFKSIVGRTLGWNVLKSSRFSVTRAGANFVFRGSGFGHGLGLCQMGAHAQAARGSGYRQILAYYFPGTTLGHVNDGSTASWHNDVLLHAAPRTRAPARTVGAAAHLSGSFLQPRAGQRLTLASAHFRVSFPAPARRAAAAALQTLEAARSDVQQRLTAAALPLPALPPLEIFAHETTGDFVGATGQPAWAAAATRGRSIHLQPLATLQRRGVLPTTLRHEYAHAVIDALGHGRTPRWLAEGLAAYAAGEGPLLARTPVSVISTAELEQKLAQPAAAAEMRALYAAAYRAVAALVQREGEARVWQRVARG